jgi:hypothetical protein
MEKNIFNQVAYETILRRINDLKPDNQRQFGTLSVNEMLCHTADQLRLAVGFIPIALQGNRVSRYFKKVIALRFNRIPPEKIETMKEVNPKKEGTKPVNFIDDQVTLVKLLGYVVEQPADYTFQAHPMFGELNQKQWGKLIYIHLDHHLRQFGV